MQDTSNRFNYQLVNSLEQLPELADAIADFGIRQGWTDALIMQINLSLEELIVNTIEYGYASGSSGLIEVVITANAEQLVLDITDDAARFNPFLLAEPDLSLSVAERPVGGLGVYLVKHYMDLYEHHETNTGNHIRLIKFLT
ncbi:ATP-binding protein [Methylocucumis oryzae]|uniref:ATP-binding protein n=1 Tax=Methylocucumis oryzae TaxID=1632867 RepID=UPI000697FA14|nr:ATP-binding protein [Methylocucumis oryzae]